MKNVLYLKTRGDTITERIKECQNHVKKYIFHLQNIGIKDKQISKMLRQLQCARMSNLDVGRRNVLNCRIQRIAKHAKEMKCSKFTHFLLFSFQVTCTKEQNSSDFLQQ
jgi:hypothetical protein